jgi:hypothetical protein
MRLDMITLTCGALALVLYFAGQIIPAAIAVSVGTGVLVWSVIGRR